MNEKLMRAPALFIGHGSPMNAIELNAFSKGWKDCASLFPKPRAILVISAHWFTNKTRINQELQPKLIYDMYGFPKELYNVQYPAVNSLEVIEEISTILGDKVTIDNNWGYDHGVWAVLKHMYPQADIPLVQLSIDYNASPKAHYHMGQKLKSLRDKGVMILGSGNVVHNLALVNWSMNRGYRWADEFDEFIKHSIEAKRYLDVVNYSRAGESAEIAFYTPEHFYPLLYVLGASYEEDELKVFNDTRILGAISMTSFLLK